MMNPFNNETLGGPVMIHKAIMHYVWTPLDAAEYSTPLK